MHYFTYPLIVQASLKILAIARISTHPFGRNTYAVECNATFIGFRYRAEEVFYNMNCNRQIPSFEVPS